MDTYKRSIRGLQSRSNGEHFEGMIIAASRFYEERGIAAVDKTPEAFAPLLPFVSDLKKRKELINSLANISLVSKQTIRYYG